MAKQLGPSFGDEVVAAGLGGLPLTWGDTDETITGREHLTTEQNATLDQVIIDHDPLSLIWYAGLVRWNTEVRGFIMNGMHIRSDEISQMKINGIRQGFSLGSLGTTVRFKAVNGWFTIDEQTIQDMYDLGIVYHVETCYLKESEVVDGINAGTITTREQIDEAFASIPWTPEEPPSP